MAEKLKVTVEQVPTGGGDTLKGSVEVPATTKATTVAAVLKHYGLPSSRKDIFVNNKPADENTVVTDGATVRLVERPQGS